MRKVLISLALAGSALVAATPATAQYYSYPGSGYNSGYGYNNYGGVREMRARIDGLQRQIDVLASRRQIRAESANHLMEETRMLEWRLRSSARNGLDPYEVRDVRQRLAVIEQRVRYAASNGYGYRNSGWNGRYDADRDRDGRDDRYEGGWRRD